MHLSPYWVSSKHEATMREDSDDYPPPTLNNRDSTSSGREYGSSRETTTNGRETARNASRARQPASRSIASLPMSQNGTIEDQIRQVDKIIKECDSSRKSLESISRRLDDLNDEVKRYRDFLGHEKSRRDPAQYKTNTVDRPSVHNESICGTMSNLTAQLVQEWSDKLRYIHNTLQSPPPSTPGSRGSDRI